MKKKSKELHNKIVKTWLKHDEESPENIANEFEGLHKYKTKQDNDNFLETHTTTGKVPCGLSGLKMDLKQNRWLGLIKFNSMDI